MEELHASPFLIPAVQHMTDLWSEVTQHGDDFTLCPGSPSETKANTTSRKPQ